MFFCWKFGCLLLLLLFEDYSVCPLSIIVVEIAIAFEVSLERLVEIWVFVVVIVELHIAGCVGRWASGEGCFLLLVVVLLQNYLHKIVLVLCSIL